MLPKAFKIATLQKLLKNVRRINASEITTIETIMKLALKVCPGTCKT